MIDMLLNSPSDQVPPSSLSSQEQGVVGMSRPPGAIPPPHPAGGVASGVGPNQGSGPPPGYVGNQQQAAMMKQMMALEQEKRVQMHMMEQQKQQLFREQRQQQQQQLLAEQVSQCVRSTRLCDDVVKKRLYDSSIMHYIIIRVCVSVCALFVHTLLRNCLCLQL